MPTYEYRRIDCEYEFDVFQRMSDSPCEICPKCGGTVKRLIGGGGGVIVKGSGHSATSTGFQVSGPRCGRENTCCGREYPCDVQPCKK